MCCRKGLFWAYTRVVWLTMTEASRYSSPYPPLSTKSIAAVASAAWWSHIISISEKLCEIERAHWLSIACSLCRKLRASSTRFATSFKSCSHVIILTKLPRNINEWNKKIWLEIVWPVQWPSTAMTVLRRRALSLWDRHLNGDNRFISS